MCVHIIHIIQCIFTYTHMYIFPCVYTQIYTYTHIYVKYIYTHICVCNVCICVYICICVYVVCVYVYIFVHMYMCRCIYVCTYICICVGILGCDTEYISHYCSYQKNLKTTIQKTTFCSLMVQSIVVFNLPH